MKIATPARSSKQRSAVTMPKVVDVEFRRQEFLQASVAMVAREGLAAATLRRIADAAGCTTGALTHYFPNRDVLLVDTLRWVHRSAGERMTRIAKQTPDDYGRLTAVVEEALPLHPHSLIEWRVWLAFWGAAMTDAGLTEENRRRYDQWQAFVRTLVAPFVPVASLAFETRQLVMLIDGLGTDLARQSVDEAETRIIQTQIRSHATEHLVRFKKAT